MSRIHFIPNFFTFSLAIAAVACGSQGDTSDEPGLGPDNSALGGSTAVGQGGTPSTDIGTGGTDIGTGGTATGTGAAPTATGGVDTATGGQPVISTGGVAPASGGQTVVSTGGVAPASGGQSVVSTGGVAPATGGAASAPQGGTTQPSTPIADANVVINEFVASNQTGITDIGGGTGDWLELYNKTGAAIDLGGYFVSDAPDNPQKAQLAPGLVIPANGMLLLWADSDPEQGDDHLPFNLAKAGETLLLTAPTGELLDAIDYVDATTDVSFARIPDGTGPFRFCPNPTPNAPNDPACGG